MARPFIKIFISYAHDDGKFFKVFEKTLKTQLKTNKKFDFSTWTDSDIYIGSLWDNEIQKNLKECDLALLCISDSFLASDYIKTKEFGNLISLFPDTLLAPLLFAPCNYTDWDDLASRQIFMPKGNLYNQATNKDFTFADLVAFNHIDGDLIPNPNISRYTRDFISQVEHLLQFWLKNKGATASPDSSALKLKSNFLNPTSYPYFETKNFFGRYDLLQRIHTEITDLDIPLLLSGIGGMGKTAVAIAYGKLEKYNKAYDNIIWIDVTDNILSNLFSSLHKHPTIPFEYSGNKQTDTKVLADLLKNVPGNNLLIIDNANNEDDVSGFITEWKLYKPTWKSLLTTRIEDSNYKDHLIKIESLSFDAAIELFQRHNDDDFDKVSFKKIYEHIAGHTFLIELLAKFGKENSIINSTKEILNHLQKKGIAALNRKVWAKRGQQKDNNQWVSEFVMNLYDPSSLTEQEQEYLRYFSILPAKEIEFQTLCLIFDIADFDFFDIILGTLAKRGWLIRNKNSFKCHQIIQEICKEKLKPDTKNCTKVMTALTLLLESENIDSTIGMEIGLSIISNMKESDSTLGYLQITISDMMVETGNLTDSLIIISDARNTFSSLVNKYNEAICLLRIGIIYKLQGNEEKALDIFVTVKEMVKQISITNNNDSDNDNVNNFLATCCHYLGYIYQEQKKNEKALEVYSEGLEITKKFSDENPDHAGYRRGLAVAYQNVGDIYITEKKYEEALEYFLLYNKIMKKLVDEFPNSRDYKNGLAISYQKLGDVYKKQGQISAALKEYSLDNMIQKELVKKYPNNVEFKNNLAITYTTLASVSSADEKKDYYRKAKEIWEALVIQVPLNVEYKHHLNWVNNFLEVP